LALTEAAEVTVPDY